MIALVETLAAGSPPAASGTHSPSPPAAAASPPAAPVFDPELALQRCFNNPIMLRDMIRCFFADVDSLFPQMFSALQEGDLQEVGRLGHRMKGTVVYLGAEPASEAALRVEHFEQYHGAQADAEEAVRALAQQCEVLKTALAEHQPETYPAPEG